MNNIIITGATGMIGGLALNYCLERDDVAKVTSIVRRKSGIAHPKLVEIVHDNFLDFSKIEKHFTKQDLCLFCIGVYTGAVPRDTFRVITVDYTRKFAETLKQQSPSARFCFLSGQGADSTEKSRVMFAQDKGIAENILKKLDFSALHIFRPGYIYPVTPRKEPNWTYRLMRSLYKPISSIYPNIGISSEALAKAMVSVGLDGGDQVIYENKDIRTISN